MKMEFNGKKGVAVDVDGVLACLFENLLEYYNSRFGTKFTENDLYTLKLWEVWGLSEGEEKPIIIDFCKSPFFRDVSPVAGSQEAVHALSKKYNLAVLTARPVSTREKTISWLDRFYPGVFSDVHFTSHHFPENGTKVNKSDFCLEHGYGILIDDYHEHVNECAEKGIQTILLTQPWNWETLRPKVRRVRNWQEVLQYLEK
ncbi:hypothetical protein HYT25_04780 [Candidatus Pacearchaeota archaeon]|nr:hypothetical protein [Candidatus Pacearchaeota archaeon]